MPKNDATREFPLYTRMVGGALICLFLLIAMEIASFVALKYVVLRLNPSLVYVTPKVEKKLYNDYLQHRHPVLGWSTASPERKYSATLESRPHSSFPDSYDYCISTYGDSYTYGAEVKDHETWVNRLSELLDCKVANFGIGGYGMDQAYLRFTLNKEDKAPVTMLGVYPDNVLRNLNRYRPFFAGHKASYVGFKPRFIFENDVASLLPPPPPFTYDELVTLLPDPNTYFPFETFLPDSPYGPATISFPYTLSLLHVARSPSIRALIKRKPTWMIYLEKGHPTRAKQIADYIISGFKDTATARKKSAVLTIFPTVSSYRYFKRTGELATQSLVDAATKYGVHYIDLHLGIDEYLGDRDYCDLLKRGCKGHLNPEGNRVVANLLHTMLSDTQLLNIN